MGTGACAGPRLADAQARISGPGRCAHRCPATIPAVRGPVGMAVGVHIFLAASAAGMCIAAAAFTLLRPLRGR